MLTVAMGILLRPILPICHCFGSLSCSRLSDFFRYLIWKEGHVIFNYVDDLIGIGPDSSVHVTFQKLLILHDFSHK